MSPERDPGDGDTTDKLGGEGFIEAEVVDSSSKSSGILPTAHCLVQHILQLHLGTQFREQLSSLFTFKLNINPKILYNL